MIASVDIECILPKVYKLGQQMDLSVRLATIVMIIFILDCEQNKVAANIIGKT